MRMLWDVLARIAAAAEARAGAGAARTQEALRGARKYLEDGHVTYLQNTIQSNRAQVGSHKRASLQPVQLMLHQEHHTSLVLI